MAKLANTTVVWLTYALVLH